MKKILLISGMTFGMLTMIGFTNQVDAFTANGADPISENSQRIQSNTNAKVDVQGWIGSFDPTKETPSDQPIASEGSYEWVDVELPTKVLFGSVKSDAGKVYGPKYQIKNNSLRPVKISIDSFTNKENPIKGKFDLEIKRDDSGTMSLLKNGEPNFNIAQSMRVEPKKYIGFTLTGNYGENYPNLTNAPLKPSYNLNFKLTAVEK